MCEYSKKKMHCGICKGSHCIITWNEIVHNHYRNCCKKCQLTLNTLTRPPPYSTSPAGHLNVTAVPVLFQSGVARSSRQMSTTVCLVPPALLFYTLIRVRACPLEIRYSGKWLSPENGTIRSAHL